MIELQIGGGDPVERLRSFPDRLAVRLAGTMRTVGGNLQSLVASNLSGRVLRSRSGRLQSSLGLQVDTDAGEITATLGVDGDVPYAAFQEYGFHGAETVRAQLRTIKQAFGRPVSPRQIAVRPYSRRVDYPAHSYLRSALAEIAPALRDAVADAVEAESEA